MLHMDYVVGIVIDELRGRGQRAGRVQIQKMVYFLKTWGIRVPYSYLISHYGVYAADLSAKLGDMEFNDIITGCGDPQGEGYHLLIDADHLSRYGGYAEIKWGLEETLSALPDLELSTLELYSTVHCAHQSLGLVCDEVSAGSVLSQVRRWKGDRFSRGEVIGALRVMRRTGLLRKRRYVSRP